MGKIVIIIEHGLVRKVLGKDVAMDTEVEIIDTDTQYPDEREANDERMKLIDENYKEIY